MYDTVVTCNMPNAGHTYIDSKGNKMIHKVLPNGIVSPMLKCVMIGPGAVFSEDRLLFEIDQAVQFGYLGSDVRIMVHPNATVLLEEHTEAERLGLSGISSTMQGSMAAMIHKMARPLTDSPTAAAKFNRYVCSHQEWMDALTNADSILAEGSQGYSLGINTQFYPYTTSRDCTPARFLSDMGIPHNMLRKVIGTARTFPIRVGNTEDGFSGPCYEDQEETSWEAIGQVPETTTVTGRIRRVFTFSLQQIKEACFHCAPDEIFLNFAQYPSYHDCMVLVDEIEQETKVPVMFTGWGPAHGDISIGNRGA
jgi:adenylosuccinate synthase